MTEQTVAALYQAEQVQSDTDHHTPTAGAMIGHVLSNLKFQEFKLEQYWWYAKANNDLFQQLAEANHQAYLKVISKMLDAQEIVPTTVQEMLDYKFLDEGGQNKYFDTETMLKDTVLDYNKANMFVTRAIKLAEKEENYPLAQAMIDLLSYHQHAIRLLENKLGYHVDPDADEDDED
ncbi:ferritin-like domain-containing protein [Agrilactobacillus yilanensis]|uniref:Ferritin-like domain-containing protein n=1 Tax=Agrilactobacillus yilanensis TaxID=2485997 RepID=A0ABW4J713_9LACO|nr:ferritin-like domain-containing protein [Agrilactobacillus yilanensis]